MSTSGEGRTGAPSDQTSLGLTPSVWRDDATINKMFQLSGNVLITGGAGYIGRAIVRRAMRDDWKARFTIISRDEYKQEQMRKRYPHCRYVLGDILDATRLEDIMWGHDLVIHAAAMKYIPKGEIDSAQCLDVNLRGSYNVINSAKAAGVSRVVGLSTDKATTPLNVYGATKFLMERIFAEMDDMTQTREGGCPRFTCVRYGNVIGSTGSLIPVLREMWNAYHRLSLTEPSMTRFWITADEAIDLICAASMEVDRGVVIIPEARSMEIEALARCVVPEAFPYDKLSDCQDVVIIGIRPGEKMHEALINEPESLRALKGRDGLWRLYRPTHMVSKVPFEITSDKVERISDADLIAAVAEAEQI